MALVTVQRTPTPSNSPESLSSELDDGLGEEVDGLKPPSRSRRSKDALKQVQKVVSSIRFINRIRFSESYLAVKGAALILPQSECARTITRKSGGGDICNHLQSMFYLLRPQDTIKVAVKLETSAAQSSRYMAVVSTMGRQDTEESVVLGIDIVDEKATIGLVMEVWCDINVRLDGDGGFSLTSKGRHHIFKPVSVQAMWSALQSLNKVQRTSQQNNYHPKGLTHTWVSYYAVRIKSDQTCINEWNVMDDIESHRPDATITLSSEKIELERCIRSKLKEVMMTVDLEDVTSLYLRTRLEEEMKMGLRDYRAFIDGEMIIILRQMDSPSQIFDHLYLGSEWNASNLEELKNNGVECILNVTREIDNFFPEMFKYCNVRLWDEESSELLKFWDDTFKFIAKAKEANQKVLVHCKMGVSRSASTVIAYAMKEYGWSLEQAYQHVKQRRSCIKPNAGFMKQLVTYQGILDASKQRHNKLWRSISMGNLNESSSSMEEYPASTDLELDLEMGECRPRSWSPADNAAQILIKTHGLASDGETSEEDPDEAYQEYHSLSPPKNQGPQIPFLSCLDNWEDYDISSRSAESLDECFEEFDARDLHFTDGNPVLLLKYQTGVEIFELGEEEEDVDSESEFEDEWKPQRGFYDVSMLTGYEGPQSEDIVSNCVDSELTKKDEFLFLHPDVKLECMIAQSKKQLRIAKLLRLSEMLREKENAAQHSKVVTANQLCLSEPQPTRAVTPTPKLKPDDFWIKEIPVEETGEEGGETAPEEPPPEEELPEVIELLEEVVEEAKDSEEAEPEVILREPVPPHYENEDIPWSPGQVKRTTHQLEHRISTSGDRLRLSSQSSEEDSEEPEQVDTDSSEISEDAAQSLYEMEEIPLEPGLVRRTRMEIEERERSVSLVETSEGRPVQRSASWKTEGERSAHKSKVHDRSSERRKTCLPIITPTVSSDCLSTEGEVQVYKIGQEDVQMKRDKVKRTTLDFEGRQDVEQLIEDLGIIEADSNGEIPAGSVKQQKEEIERKYGPPLEPTKSTEAEPETKEIVAAYPEEEGIAWSVGTVKQQTAAIESKAMPQESEEEEGEEEVDKNLLSKMLLIRHIGAALVDSPSDAADVKSKFHSRMVIVEKSDDPLSGRSSSFRETSPTKLLEGEQNFRRTSSLRDSKRTLGAEVVKQPSFSDSALDQCAQQAKPADLERSASDQLHDANTNKRSSIVAEIASRLEEASKAGFSPPKTAEKPAETEEEEAAAHEDIRVKDLIGVYEGSPSKEGERIDTEDVHSKGTVTVPSDSDTLLTTSNIPVTSGSILRPKHDDTKPRSKSTCEQPIIDCERKVRKLQGRTHPLSVLSSSEQSSKSPPASSGRSTNPLYNTM